MSFIKWRGMGRDMFREEDQRMLSGLRLFFVHVYDVFDEEPEWLGQMLIHWSDTKIREMTEPPYELTELSLADSADIGVIQEAVFKLAPMIDEACRNEIMLGVAGEFLRRGGAFHEPWALAYWAEDEIVNFGEPEAEPEDWERVYAAIREHWEVHDPAREPLGPSAERVEAADEELKRVLEPFRLRLFEMLGVS